MVRLTWEQAAAWRMRRHHLVERAPAGSLLAVASRLCGLHAQLMSSAELTAWARIENLDREGVPRALWQDRTLVKTWAMRGTLHLLPAGELPLWYGALSTSGRFLRPAAWQKYFGLTMEDLDRITEAIGDVLDGRLLTREELAREVAQRTGSNRFGSHISTSSWGTVLRPASFAGRLCFGPSAGQRVRFTRPDSWLGAARQSPPPLAPAEAIAAVTRRFLGAYGPATYHDLGRWWNGGAVATARQWIASLGGDASEVDVEGTRAWMLASDVHEVRQEAPARSVRLLPAFDQYVVGASWHARHLLAGDLRARVYRPQGWISPVLLVNGRMHGTWRHEMKGSRVEVFVEPFVKSPAWVRRAAAAEAERLAAFLGGKCDFEWKA